MSFRRPNGAKRPHARLRGAVCASLLVVGSTLFSAEAHAERVRLDGIAAVVGGATPRAGTVVVYASDVELDAWLERARRDAGGDVAEGRLSAQELSAARERLIGRSLLVLEASRLRLDDLDEPQLAAAWRRFFERHGGARAVEAVVARLGLGNDELERYVRREGVARSFVLANSELGAIVSDAELDAEWARGDHPYVGMDRDTVREAFRTYVLDRRIEDETERWIERLRLRVPVVVPGAR